MLSLCIDLARWYEPAPEHNSAEAVGELYAGLVIRMLRAGAKQALGLVRSRAAVQTDTNGEVQMEISCAFPTALDSPEHDRAR